MVNLILDMYKTQTQNGCKSEEWCVTLQDKQKTIVQNSKIRENLGQGPGNTFIEKEKSLEAFNLV